MHGVRWVLGCSGADQSISLDRQNLNRTHRRRRHGSSFLCTARAASGASHTQSINHPPHPTGKDGEANRPSGHPLRAALFAGGIVPGQHPLSQVRTTHGCSDSPHSTPLPCPALPLMDPPAGSHPNGFTHPSSPNHKSQHPLPGSQTPCARRGGPSPPRRGRSRPGSACWRSGAISTCCPSSSWSTWRSGQREST